MNENSYSVLTNQIIGILTTYILYRNIEEIAAVAEIGRDTYQQGKDLYEVVKTRFTEEYGSTADDWLINEKKKALLQSNLSAMLQDADFEKEVRQLISNPPLIRRTQELQEYKRFLNRDTSWIWIIKSLEKNGKTKLLQQMKEKEPRIPVVKIDFAKEKNNIDAQGKQNPLNEIEFLESFASQIKIEECNAGEIEGFQVALQQTRSEKARKRHKFVINLHSGNGSTPSNKLMHSEIETYSQELEREALEIIEEAFFNLMDSFQPNRLIIHLDTCERLMEEVNKKTWRWLVEDILLRLYQRMRERGKHLHVIMMSSIALSLPESEHLEYEESELSLLEQSVVKEYLQKAGINDDRLLEQFCIMTEGHAYSVYLLRKLWQQWEKKGKALPEWQEERELLPDVEIPLVSFQKEFYEKVEREFINICILEKFDKSLLGKSTKFGIILREFDVTKFTTVFSTLLESEPDPEVVFRQLVRRLYVIEEKGKRTYSIRDLLRAALAQRILQEHPEDWEKYHQRAINFWWNKTRNPIELLNTPDWYYHNLAYYLGKNDNEAAGRLYWTETLEGLKKLGVNEPEPLIVAANDKTLMFFRKYKKPDHREG